MKTTLKMQMEEFKKDHEAEEAIINEHKKLRKKTKPINSKMEMNSKFEFDDGNQIINQNVTIKC